MTHYGASAAASGANASLAVLASTPVRAVGADAGGVFDTPAVGGGGGGGGGGGEGDGRKKPLNNFELNLGRCAEGRVEPTS